MTEIEQKALALVNEPHGKTKWLPHEIDRIPYFGVICRAIEQHEAFRQEVGDAVAEAHNEWCAYRLGHDSWNRLVDLIIPKPDPLVEALREAWPGTYIDDAEAEAAQLRAALAARGLTITEIKE